MILMRIGRLVLTGNQESDMNGVKAMIAKFSSNGQALDLDALRV